MNEVSCTVKYYSLMIVGDNRASLLILVTRYILNSNPSKNVCPLCLAGDCTMEGQP